MGGGWGEGEGAGQVAAVTVLDCLAEKSREKRRVISRERRQEEQPVILDKNLDTAEVFSCPQLKGGRKLASSGHTEA